MAALNRPDIGKRLDDAGFTVAANGPDDLAARIRSEIDKMTKLVRTIGLRPE